VSERLLGGPVDLAIQRSTTVGWLSAGQVVDDRGNRVPLLNARRLTRDADDAKSPRQELAKRLKLAMQAMAQQHIVRFVVYVILTSVVLLAAAPYVFLKIFGPFGTLAVKPVQWIVLVVGVIAFNKWIQRNYSAQLTSTVVATGICGSYGYSLKALAADAHGLLVCSECGAAWRRSRIVRPYWEGDGRAAELPRPSRRRLFLLNVPREKMLLTPDDRGMFVRAVDSKLVLLGAEARERLGAERVHLLTQALVKSGRRTRRIAAILQALWLVFPFMLIWNVRGEADQVVLIAAIGLASLAFIVGMVVMYSSVGYKPGVGARIFVADNLCGSCAADLSQLTPQDDGCVVCERCKAAWRRAEPAACDTRG
jgi:hypothetical protein